MFGQTGRPGICRPRSDGTLSFDRFFLFLIVFANDNWFGQWYSIDFIL